MDGGSDQEGDEGRGHHLAPGSVNVPGVVRHIKRGHSSCRELLFNVSAC